MLVSGSDHCSAELRGHGERHPGDGGHGQPVLGDEVPLSAGANTITLVVTTQDGATASQAITVTAAGRRHPSPSRSTSRTGSPRTR